MVKEYLRDLVLGTSRTYFIIERICEMLRNFHKTISYETETVELLEITRLLL